MLWSGHNDWTVIIKGVNVKVSHLYSVLNRLMDFIGLNDRLIVTGDVEARQ